MATSFFAMALFFATFFAARIKSKQVLIIASQRIDIVPKDTLNKKDS